MDGKMCVNSSCGAPDLISLVPSAMNTNSLNLSPNIVIEPHIVKNPLVIKGYTTVFNVNGKLFDAADEKKSSSSLKNQIKYKILPNTHIHVTNTVIIDTEKDILRKIEEDDPVTIKKLLDSQTISAVKRLNTFIEQISKNNGTTNSNDVINLAITKKSGKKSLTNNSSLNLSQNELKVLTPSNKKMKLSSSALTSTPTNVTPQIQFIPAKSSNPTNLNSSSIQKNESMATSSTVHSTLKIASVTSMNEASKINTIQPVAIQAAPVAIQAAPVAIKSSPVAIKSSPVVIQAVPMAAIQTAPIAIKTVSVKNLPSSKKLSKLQKIAPKPPVQTPVVQATVFTDQEKSELQKMREEITELKEIWKQITGNVRPQD